VKWLLDTNVVSEGVRKKPNTNVVTWVATKATVDVAISIVTLAELRDGALSVRDQATRRTLIEWIDNEVAGPFSSCMLPLNTEVLIDWLTLSRRLRAKRITRDSADLLLAATARVFDLIVVTRNVRDFGGTGVVVYDPWNDETHRMERI
jgi:predicted nucleic acid-binding protein